MHTTTHKHTQHTHTQHTHTHRVVYQGSGTEEKFFSEEKGFQGLDKGVVC